MKRINAILRRDYASFFRSPIGYVVLAIYMFLNGIYYTGDIGNNVSDIGGQIGAFEWVVFILLIPLITMRIFSEDRKNGTEILLLTSPASVWEIVFGKYLAVFSVFMTMIASSFIFPILTVAFGGNVDAKAIGVYIGFIGLGAAFLAVGVFASSMTENQVIAAVISVTTVVVLMLFQLVASIIGGLVSSLLSTVNIFGLTDLQLSNASAAVTEAVNWVNPMTRLDNFAKGVFELAPILYFLSVVAIFLFLTVRMIEKRRWSQG
jgi:ABC-2 type transport system permease protein